MTSVVGYFRVANSEAAEDRSLIATLRRDVHSYADHRRLPVSQIFMDRYGIRRSPRSQFPHAIELVRQCRGVLVIPTLGKTRRDPDFLEALYNANVPFTVLDQADLSSDTVLAEAMTVYRSDLRRVT